MVERQSSDSPVSDWSSFADTVLHFCSRPNLVIDLRKKVDSRIRTVLQKLDLERPFGIISVQEPMGVPQPKDVSVRLAASLKVDVAELRVAHVHLDACSPDRSHCEQSVAIVLDLDSLIALAYRYNQLAIFWFDGDQFWIVPVRSSNARLRLPVSA